MGRARCIGLSWFVIFMAEPTNYGQKKGANSAHFPHRHREAPLQKMAKPRPDGRVPGWPLEDKIRGFMRRP